MGVLVLSLTVLVACGGKTDTKSQSSSTKSSVNSSTKDSDTGTSKAKYQKSDLIKSRYDFAMGVDCTVDIPGWQGHISGGGYDVNSNDMYIILDQYAKSFEANYGYSLDTFKTVKDIFPGMLKQFMDCSDGETSTHNGRTAIITKDEITTINGNEMDRFEGYIVAKDDKVKDGKHQIIGYSTIFKGKPLYFVIVDQTADQTKKADMTKIIDAMAHSFREYNEKE